VDRSIREGWQGLVGFVNDEKIGGILASRNLRNSLFVVCGPPILGNIVEKSLTTQFKVKPEQFFRF
jgi:NAD(P)H-flavin reductase